MAPAGGLMLCVYLPAAFFSMNVEKNESSGSFAVMLWKRSFPSASAVTSTTWDGGKIRCFLRHARPKSAIQNSNREHLLLRLSSMRHSAPAALVYIANPPQEDGGASLCTAPSSARVLPACTVLCLFQGAPYKPLVVSEY